MSCVVWGCESHSSRKENSQELLTYYRFPVENDQKKWINRIGSRKWIPKKHSHICSKHFTLDSFVCATNLKWRRLRENATLTFDEMVCRICLARDMELHDVEFCGLKCPFETLTNCLLSQDGFPERLCWECRARLLSYARFREKALRSQALLTAATLFQQCNVEQLKYIDPEEDTLTSSMRAITLVDHYDFEICWSVKEEPEDVGYKVEVPEDVAHEVKELIDTGHEVKSELELGPERLQSDFSFYHARQLSNQAEICESTGDDDDKCAIHAVVGEDASQTDIDESASCEEKNFRNLTCDNQAMSPKLVESGKVIYIKPDSEEHSTSTMATSKNSQHVMNLRKDHRLFTCSRCGRVCNRKINLLEHLMVHSGERPFKCICGSRYIRKRCLKEHIEEKRCGTSLTSDEVEDSKQEQCTVATVQNSVEHKMNLNIDFECDKCGKSYRLKSELRKHIITHMLLEESMRVSRNTYLCTVCHNTFATNVEMSEHVKNQHPAHYETVQKYKLMLRDTQKKRPSEKSYKCDSCDFKSSRKQRLKEHVMCKHVNKKPYKCRYCESSFNLEYRLRLHERVHTGERPYRCKYCSYASRHHSGLCAHQKLHFSDKPHKCGLCDYRAARKQYINAHILNVHTRERPIKCELCTFACNSNSRLKDHMLVHTSEKPYECGNCSFKTKRIRELNYHVVRHRGAPAGTSVVES